MNYFSVIVNSFSNLVISVRFNWNLCEKKTGQSTNLRSTFTNFVHLFYRKLSQYNQRSHTGYKGHGVRAELRKIEHDFKLISMLKRKIKLRIGVECNERIGIWLVSLIKCANSMLTTVMTSCDRIWLVAIIITVISWQPVMKSTEDNSSFTSEFRVRLRYDRRSWDGKTEMRNNEMEKVIKVWMVMRF